MEEIEEVEEPIGKFILDNLPMEKRVLTTNGLYVHYSDVCQLLKTLVMPLLPRTEADIEKEINRLINDDSNFISDNYGSEAANNGEHGVYFSRWKTEETLKGFVKWLLGNKV